MSNTNNKPEPLRRAVIKEELVGLTGDFVKAVLLNQFIYWSERVRDFDKFIAEERRRMEAIGEDVGIEKQNGWIYKTAEELSQETMLGLSPQTIRRHLKVLIDNGWLDERKNPRYKWDRTVQYHVNIVEIQRDLAELGYALEGYPLEEESLLEFRNDTFGDSTSILEIQATKMENQNRKTGEALPENTTEITTENTTINTYALNSANEYASETQKREQSKKPRNPFRSIKQEDRFDTFWEEYPRKRSKGQAEKTWIKIDPDEETFKAILEGLDNAKRSIDWQKDGGQYIPYPSTWLNAKGWEDEYEEVAINGTDIEYFGEDDKRSAGRGRNKDPLAGFIRAEELDFYREK